MSLGLNVCSVHLGRSAFMETVYSNIVAGCEPCGEIPMDTALDTIHQLDPPPPDVLLALLARNKALEGEVSVTN